MANCDANDLLNTGRNFAYLSERQVNTIIIELLCRILRVSNPMASCDAQELLDDGKCFLCLSEKQAAAVQIQLLCEILHSGGTGTTCLVCGDAPPVDDAPCDCSIYYTNPPNAGVWVWDSVTSAWECIINPGLS